MTANVVFSWASNSIPLHVVIDIKHSVFEYQLNGAKYLNKHFIKISSKLDTSYKNKFSSLSGILRSIFHNQQ